MRFSLFSDLHNEIPGARWIPPALDVDLVILAGDIGGRTHGLDWAAQSFPNQEIAYVAGNHEYYGAHLALLDELRKKAEGHGIHLLERNTLEIAGVRILGCTLWSGFDLYGPGASQTVAMIDARQNINDYWEIRARRGKRLEPRDTQVLHRQSVFWLGKELDKPFMGKTVVVTHFAPHRGCVAPQHDGENLTPYFVSDMSRLMEKHRIDVWCYGHTHTNTDFVAEGGCRVVSNQRGYPRDIEKGAAGFRDDFVIEL